MESPYNKIELLAATISANKKLVAYSEKHGEPALEKAMNNLVEGHATDDLTGKIADHYKISRLDLVNSPNYKSLVDEFNVMTVKAIISDLKETFDFNDKESWAILLQATQG